MKGHHVSHIRLSLVLLTGVLCGSLAMASFEPGSPQDETEKSIEAVVRHKNYFKTGKIEFGPTAGVMPYDSLVNHYMLGGRLSWHLSDHFGWEIADAQLGFPTVTSYTTDLVSGKGISNLQTQKLKFMVGSNFLMSPIYGKIRLFGGNVLYFDVYLVAGLGAASTETIMVSAAGTGQPASESVVKTGIDPMFDFGLGFKLFLNNAMSFNLDLRDYVVSSQIYGSRVLKSNYSVFLGVSFFLPTFG